MIHSVLRVARVLMLAGALYSCASGPRIYTSQDPQAAFDTYRTFAFEARLGTDRPDGYASLLSQYLKTATRAEMERRGYRYSEENPDLSVNFFVNTQEKIRSRTTPSPDVYYTYRRGYYRTWGGYETTIAQYTEGTLNIDIIDAKRDQLVWEGVAIGRVSEKARENLQAAVNGAVVAVFAEYPYSAR